MNKIQDFYNKFTYPFTEVKPNVNLKGEALFVFLNFEADMNDFQGKRILDAGCGTGQRLIDIARTFPDAYFVGIDFSCNSIEIAKRQAASEGLKNIEFICADIYSYKAEQPFDIINSYGVIHHLPEPRRAVENLSKALKDDGLMIVWLYHKYGEFDRMLCREVINTLISDKNDFDSAAELMRDLNYKLSEERYGERTYGDSLNIKDELSKDADAFLHPHVMPYTFDEASMLLKDCGFEWVSVEQINMEGKGYFIGLGESRKVPKWILDINELLDSRKAQEYYEKLSKKDKLHVVELIAKPTGFTIFAGKSKAVNLLGSRTRGNLINAEEI